VTLFCIAAALFRAHGISALSLRKKAVQRWCFVGTAFWAVRHFCIAMVLFWGAQHGSFVAVFLWPQDIGDLSPWPFGATRHWGFFVAFWGRATLFALPWSFLGCATSILHHRGFFAATRHWGFVGAAPRGRATLFALPQSFFRCTPWSLHHCVFCVDAFWRENANEQSWQRQLTATCPRHCRSNCHGSIQLICNVAICDVAN